MRPRSHIDESSIAWAAALLPAVVCVAAVALSAKPAIASVIDFEGLPAGTPVTEIDGVTFSADVSPYPLAVISRFETSSGDRALGVDDGGFSVLLPGDVVTLAFAQPIEFLSVRFVSSPNTPAGVYQMTTTAGSASSATTPDAVLPDQGEVFRVVFASATPFTLAQLTGGDGLYSYNVDDIVFAPEPTVPIGIGAGSMLLLDLQRRRRSRRATHGTHHCKPDGGHPHAPH